MEYADISPALWEAAYKLRDNFVRGITIETTSSIKMRTRDAEGLRKRIEAAGFKILMAKYQYIDGDMSKPFWGTFEIEILPSE